MLDKIKWLGHSSFMIETHLRIYIDPWKLKVSAPADIILVSHPHFDHLVVEDINKIRQPNTVIITTADGVKEIKGKTVILLPGEKTSVEDIIIEGVPAY
ncbi:MAG: MBL fold metallo-hydrolase, partial [Candidatus Sumerlaeia bacterium]|nr:MBL fold metallo-hydrolase [Candidatus Sumerlaeia bacterium]